MRGRQNCAAKQVLNLNIAYDQRSPTLEEFIKVIGMPPAWSLSFSVSQVPASGREDEIGSLGWHKEASEPRLDSNITSRHQESLGYFLSMFLWTLDEWKKSWGHMYGKVSYPLLLVTHTTPSATGPLGLWWNPPPRRLLQPGGHTVSHGAEGLW